MIFTPLEKAVWVYIEMLAGVLKLSSEYQQRGSATYFNINLDLGIEIGSRNLELKN
jgi:hypothetical protein